MAIVVPDVGENLIVGMITNKTAPENWSVRLFVNNITPAETDTAATYTVATFPGYANVTLTGATWGTPASGSTTYGSQISFTASGTSTDDVYGYYVVQVTSGILLLAERAASAPFAIRVSGDAVKMTPAITAS